MRTPSLWLRIKMKFWALVLDHMPRELAEMGFIRVWTDVVPEEDRYMERFTIAEIWERWTLST